MFRENLPEGGRLWQKSSLSNTTYSQLEGSAFQEFKVKQDGTGVQVRKVTAAKLVSLEPKGVQDHPVGGFLKSFASSLQDNVPVSVPLPPSGSSLLLIPSFQGDLDVKVLLGPCCQLNL